MTDWHIPWVSKLPKVYQRWQQDDGPLMAAAVAYYAALSFFPLLLVLISGVGLVMQHTAWGQDAQEQVLATIADYASPAVRDNVATMLSRVQRNAALGGPLGIMALMFVAAALFVQFQRAFDRIWNVDSSAKKGLLATAKDLIFIHLRGFLMLLCLGTLILVVFLAGVILASLKDFSTGYLPFATWFWWVVEIGTSVTLNAGVFTLLYRLLPKVTIRWSEAFRGALMAAVLWEVARLILNAFVIGEKYSAYGIVGSFIAVMLWIYFASSIIFISAEYIQVICEECMPDSADSNK